MHNGSRLFAYTTWVVMISLAIIVFINRFLVYITDPGWVGLAALLGFGFIYLNFSYLAAMRYIRKTQEETKLHFVLAFLIFLPPAVWVMFLSNEIEGSRLITVVVLAFSCGLGAVYGYRSGKRQQKHFMQKTEHENQPEPDS